MPIIADIVDTSENVSEQQMYNIQFILSEPEIRENLNSSGIDARKHNTVDIQSEVISLITKSELPIEMAKYLSNKIKNNETIIAFSSIDKNTITNMLDIVASDVQTKVEELDCDFEWKKFLTSLIKCDVFSGSKAHIGAGEWVCMIMDPNCSENENTGSDLVFKDGNSKVDIEIKGPNGGRLEGSAGYVSPEPAGVYLFEQIKELTGTYYGDKDKGNYFNPCHWKTNLNEVITDHNISRDKVIDFVANFFCKIYTEFDDNLMITRVSSFIDNDATVNQDKFREVLAFMQFEYYQKLKNFDSVMFFNATTYTVGRVSTPEFFVDNLDKFSYNMSISLKEKRNMTSQFTIS